MNIANLKRRKLFLISLSFVLAINTINILVDRSSRVFAQSKISLSDMGLQLDLPDSYQYTLLMPERLESITVAQMYFGENQEVKPIRIEIAAQNISSGQLNDIIKAENMLFSEYEGTAIITNTITINNREAEYRQYSHDDAITIMEARLMVGQTYYVISTIKSVDSEYIFNAVLNGTSFKERNNLPINEHSILSFQEEFSTINSFPNLKFPYNGTKIINCAYYYDDPACHSYSIYALDFNLDYEPVRAAHSGNAIAGYRSDWGTYITITYDGDTSYYTYYGHLNSVTRTGYVAQGDYIAVSGESGSLATGPHLHFSLNYNGSNIKPEPMCGITGFLRYDEYEDCWVDDSSPPVSTISLSGTAGENGWYKSSVVATITATDNSSGVSYTQYNLDGAGWVTYTAPVSINTDGSHILQYRSVDKAGNWETAKSVAVKIDTVAPAGVIWIMDGWETTYQTVVSMDTLAGDNTSGVALYQLRDAGGTWTGWLPHSMTSQWILPAQTGQTYAVEAQYKDYAGNISPIYSDSIHLDIYPERPASQNYQLSKSTFGMGATDAQSANFQLQGTLSQVSAIGVAESDNYQAVSGYWSWISNLVQRFFNFLPFINK